MTRIILIALLTLTISCGNEHTKEEIIKPKWSVGDSKVFNEKGSMFIRMDSDTIMNVAYEKNIKVIIVDKIGQDYIVEIEPQPIGDLSMTTSIDSLKDLSVRMTNALDVLKDLSKFIIPYRIKVSENGEIIDIVDFDSYFEKFMGSIVKAKDSIKITDEEKETIKLLSNNKGTIIDKLQTEIAKESSELLSIYNIQNPINGDIVEETTMPNPKTGEELPTTLTYHSKSVNGDTQEIELNIRIHESLNDILADSTQNQSKNKLNYQDMVNLTTYSFNHKTGWLEGSTSTIDFTSDTFEMKIRATVKVQE
jgi:hypothetical protein